MSRTSPSGPGAITDKFNTVAIINPGTDTPGTYFVFPSIVQLFVGGDLIPEAGLDPDAVLLLGPETRSGHIGKTRITLFAISTTAGSAPINLQWNVNGVPVGAVVTIPWTTTPALSGTYAETCELVKALSAEYEFPGAVWQAGDFVILQVDIGVLVGVDMSIVIMALEKNYP